MWSPLGKHQQSAEWQVKLRAASQSERWVLAQRVLRERAVASGNGTRIAECASESRFARAAVYGMHSLLGSALRLNWPSLKQRKGSRIERARFDETAVRIRIPLLRV